jgi:hypothetical protein
MNRGLLQPSDVPAHATCRTLDFTCSSSAADCVPTFLKCYLSVVRNDPRRADFRAVAPVLAAPLSIYSAQFRRSSIVALTCTSTSSRSTPAGRLMFQITGAFAEFERSMIRQRINAGLKRAVEAGQRLGRPADTRRGREANSGSIAFQERHAGNRQGVWRRDRHGPTHCARDDRGGSPFRRRRRRRIGGR